MKEKQLEDVDFTFRELERIKKSFVEVLRSMYHSRETLKKEDLSAVQRKEKA
jgi:membrane-associated HD superfamily phosphohydrolase